MNPDDLTEGRWLTPDLLGGDIANPQSLNRYAYALNNPATLTDPLGLDPSGCTSQIDENGNPYVSCSGPDTVTVNGGEPPSLGLIMCELGFGGCGQTTITGPVTGYSQSGGGGGGWGGAPAPKPVPPGWVSTFAKSFFSTQSLTTAWNSLVSPNGCTNLLFKTFGSDLNPIPTGPSLADTIKPAADFTSAAFIGKALNYAASQPNFLGGTGLLYPLKSNVVQNLMTRAQAVEDIVPEVTIGYAAGDAVITDIVAAAQGKCH